MFLRMKPAQRMGPAFPAFLAPSGATPFDTDLAELGCHGYFTATSGRSVDDLFVIAYQIYALALGLLIAYLISTAV